MTRRPRLTSRLRQDDGSLILAMLASLLVAGLAVALIAVVNQSQRTTRLDRDYNLAINGADAGVQQAVTVLGRLGDEPSRLSVTPADVDVALSGTELAVGATTYDWSATKIGPQSWLVTSTGTAGARSRTVEAVVERPARFFLAAFADIGFTMRGGNQATSYDGGGHGTGNGAVGSNGGITMNGNAFADLVMLLGAGATCNGGGAGGGACAGNGGTIVGFQDAFDLSSMSADITTRMQDLGAAGAPCDPAINDYVASRDGQLAPGTYCFTDVTFDVDSPLNGASATNGVRIFMTGDLTIERVNVNCPGCPKLTGNQAATAVPDTRGLVINTLGANVNISNNAIFAGAIAAPDADCSGNPSSASADIYGSLVCNSVSNQGSWRFMFDDRLLQLGSGTFDIIEWSEKVGS